MALHLFIMGTRFGSNPFGNLNSSRVSPSALIVACHRAANNALESVILLLQHGASQSIRDNDGYTALHHAAFNNSVEVLPLLVKTGTHRLRSWGVWSIFILRHDAHSPEANLNARDSSEGTTALHLASFGGFIEAVEILIKNGADMEITDHDGATPLVQASFGNIVPFFSSQFKAFYCAAQGCISGIN